MASGLFFTACDNAPETANVSRVTNYPIITVLGDDIIYVAKGGTYNDPGAIAMEGTTEIDYETSAEGNYRGETTLNTNIADEYTVTYSATNADGFKAKATRTVIVYSTGDLVNSIEGVYRSTVRRNGSLLNPAQGSSVNMEYIYIWKNTNGTYEISDAFGGWYALGRHLGLGYITPGGIINAVNIPGNSFTFPGGTLTNLGFGGTATLSSLTVDPVTQKLVLTCPWVAPPATNYNFEVTLTQVQL